MKSDNTLWKFFASVQLALFTLGCLALTSIIGTLIPQKKDAGFYVENYGQNAANFFKLFDITDMYTSWWFLTLLGLLSANLIVCTIDRFPNVWKQITQDNLDISLERIEKMGKSATLTSTTGINETFNTLATTMSTNGWKTASNKKDDAHLLFSQKNPWSRTGVYIVHLSILVIFAGAIYGQLTGFRGGIMLPELQGSSVVYPYDRSDPISLDFEVRCERFDIDFYSNGAPKLFRSELKIIKDGQAVHEQAIEVNSPLTYEGITFYQSSYQGYRDFVFSIMDEAQNSEIFTGEFQKEIQWKAKNISFGILNLESIRDRVTRVKIWFSDGLGEPSQFWMRSGETVAVERPGNTYQFSAKQRYATGLQVAKDPGVWVVYLGCGLMLIGLYMAFFMSHQRIWLIARSSKEQTIVDIRGTANKNKAGFERKFEELTQSLRENL